MTPPSGAAPPGDTAVLSLPAEIENLPALVGFVRDACARAGADPEASHALRLAVDEACTNVIRHGYRESPAGPIEISVVVSPGRIVVTIDDRAPSFSPAEAPAPDIDSGWNERAVGGLGWHFVKNVVDEVRHEARAGGGNRLVLVKNLKEDRSWKSR